MSRRKKVGLVLLGIVLLLSAWLGVRFARLGIEVAVDPAKLPADPAAPVATEFSIATYNVQARPLFDDSVHKFTRMPKVLEPYDILSFQEMFKDHARMYAGLSHGVKVYHATLKSPFKIVGSGLGTVARFPLAGTAETIFTTYGDRQNMPASKGVLLTRLRVGGMPLDVYTTHMEAGKNDAAMVSRRKQAEEIVSFVRANSKPESAVILQGDFNMRFSKPGQEHPEIQAGRVPESFTGLKREHIIDAMTAALGLKDLSRETRGEPLDGVDHILFRSGSKAVLTPLSWQHDGPEFYDENKQPLSDHEPVIGRFRIAPPAG